MAIPKNMPNFNFSATLLDEKPRIFSTMETILQLKKIKPEK
jgi:hypothetical protein